MIIEEEVDSTDAMRKKKNEPKEIPIQFVEGEEERPEGQESEEEIPAAIDADSQVARTAEEDPEENQAPDSEAAPDDESSSEAAAAPALQSQIDSLMAERSALYDQLLRRQAEFENYRKRTERDKAEFYQRARADVLMEMLPVIDNFERALSSLEKSGSADESFKHGVELIHKQFKDTLTKLGLQPIEAVGRAFDPNLHEAVTMEPTDEHEENTVVEEFERGYKLGDKLLRPAKVKVASSPDR
ncbi:MAG TPA: nucleotide exchange factor GrpE [Blastocatellia bacterium]|nr:nucleotide exchange factor GrpE [Blastocatellia bacterium]